MTHTVHKIYINNSRNKFWSKELFLQISKEIHLHFNSLCSSIKSLCKINKNYLNVKTDNL